MACLDVRVLPSIAAISPDVLSTCLEKSFAWYRRRKLRKGLCYEYISGYREGWEGLPTGPGQKNHLCTFLKSLELYVRMVSDTWEIRYCCIRVWSVWFFGSSAKICVRTTFCTRVCFQPKLLKLEGDTPGVRVRTSTQIGARLATGMHASRYGIIPPVAARRVLTPRQQQQNRNPFAIDTRTRKERKEKRRNKTRDIKTTKVAPWPLAKTRPE